MSNSYCPFCGSEIKPGDTFCNSCGASTETTPVNPVNQPYTPPPPPQQQYGQPAHQYGASAQTVYQQPAKSQTNTLGLVSIITTFLGCCSALFLPFVTLPLFLVGLITGAVGMKKTPNDKTMSLIGVIISSIGVIGSIIFIVLIVLFAGDFLYLY